MGVEIRMEGKSPAPRGFCLLWWISFRPLGSPPCGLLFNIIYEFFESRIIFKHFQIVICRIGSASMK
jgi:hypothetical protein